MRATPTGTMASPTILAAMRTAQEWMWRQPTGDGMMTAVLLQPITLSAKKVAYYTLRDISCDEELFTLRMTLSEVRILPKW